MFICLHNFYIFLFLELFSGKPAMALRHRTPCIPYLGGSITCNVTVAEQLKLTGPNTIFYVQRLTYKVTNSYPGIVYWCCSNLPVIYRHETVLFRYGCQIHLENNTLQSSYKSNTSKNSGMSIQCGYVLH